MRSITPSEICVKFESDIKVEDPPLFVFNYDCINYAPTPNQSYLTYEAFNDLPLDIIAPSDFGSGLDLYLQDLGSDIGLEDVTDFTLLEGGIDLMSSSIEPTDPGYMDNWI